jgi:hypothetical protein
MNNNNNNNNNRRNNRQQSQYGQASQWLANNQQGTQPSNQQNHPPPNPVKRFKNMNYCDTHGGNIPGDHCSSNCPKPRQGHNYHATRTTGGWSKKAMHKTILPIAAGRQGAITRRERMQQQGQQFQPTAPPFPIQQRTMYQPGMPPPYPTYVPSMSTMPPMPPAPFYQQRAAPMQGYPQGHMQPNGNNMQPNGNYHFGMNM